jgi:hypothetical protein
MLTLLLLPFAVHAGLARRAAIGAVIFLLFP